MTIPRNPDITTFTLGAVPLRRALANAALFATTDETLTALRVIWLEYDNQRDELTIASTDRYVLTWQALPVLAPAGPPAAFAIYLTDAERILRALPRQAKNAGAARLTYTHDNPPWRGHAILETQDLHTVSFWRDESDFIPWRTIAGKVLKAAEDPVPRGSIQLSMAKLGNLSRVLPHNPGDDPDWRDLRTARFTFGPDGKPALVEMGTWFKAAIMPLQEAPQ